MGKDGILSGKHRHLKNGGKKYNGKKKEVIHKMKIKILIDTQADGQTEMNRSQVWEGELDILNENEYLMLISMMIEGEAHPIVQVPFSKGIGHYIWIPPDIQESEEETYIQGKEW
jgi:hypothetical protein